MHKLIKSYTSTEDAVVTRNACKLCAPLGACVAFKGIKGCIPLIHGSQGCATYIRRYLISHYREPVDIASSSFSETSTIFGGNINFNISIDTLRQQYNPEVIGIASTCLSETIGEDVDRLIREYRAIHPHSTLPHLFFASTPAYRGTHIDGFHKAVTATIAHFSKHGTREQTITLFPGFISPADIRHLKEILTSYKVPFIIVPDYSETLDSPYCGEYKLIADGGTPVSQLERTGCSSASIEFGYVFHHRSSETNAPATLQNLTGGEFLTLYLGVPRFNIGFPIGIKETDRFFDVLNSLTGKKTPERFVKERGRLIDAYVDGHKYVFGKRALLYGDEDFVIGLTSFLTETGILPSIVATGAESTLFKKMVWSIISADTSAHVLSSADFETIREYAKLYRPDIIIGNSKGYYIARELNVPFVRVGFPIHDRFGAQRLQHLCYEGTTQLFDRIVNALLEHKQDNSIYGHKYL